MYCRVFPQQVYALGQQVWRKLHPSGQIIHSIFDLDGNRIAEYDYSGGSSTLIREYIWMDGVPVAVVEGGVVYYVRTDHIGRPVFATDSTGAKVWEATYLPFGGMLATWGSFTTPGAPPPPPGRPPALQLRFPGQWFQSESGLYQNWMRDYDPTTGRYMQADPLGLVDGASVYGYARQNPARYVDPRGEAVCGGACIAGAAVWAYRLYRWYRLGQSAANSIDPAAAGAAAAAGQNAQADAEADGAGTCEENDNERCEEAYRIDTDTCSGITRVRGRAAGAMCHASAADRYAACRANKPIPPLNTWNN